MIETPSILLIGTGAVGSYYSGKLWQAGARISAVCRSDYSVIKKNGITVKSILGDFNFMPDEVIKDINDYSLVPDYIMVATKVLPEINITDMIAPRVGKNTSIILLQNGINIEKPVADVFPDNEIISALAFICVSREQPGMVHHQDYGRLVIGHYPSGTSEKTSLLNELFVKSGVQCQLDTDIITARWKKLIWNAPFNPMSVLAGGANTQEMMGSEASLVLARKIMEEVVQLAEATGHHIPRAFITKNLDDTAVMTPYKTSMLLDYENKRPMEVEAILGNALRIAKEKNISVPHIESLYGLLSLINSKNTGKI